MATETLTGFPITRKQIVEGRFFPSEGSERNDEALRECLDSKYQPLFMPEVINARIGAENGSPLWQYWISSPSIRATGRTSQGNPVAVYAHVDNYFSNSDNIKKAIEQGLVNGAGRIPQKEFQRLLDLEGSTDEQGNQVVYLIHGKDYEKLMKSPSGVININQALDHPQTIPFVGGEKRAEQYLEISEEVFGNKIGIWHVNDLGDEPLGRLLCVSGHGGGLVGGGLLYDLVGRFLGERDEVAVQKILTPDKGKIIEIINENVPEKLQREVNERIGSILESL